MSNPQPQRSLKSELSGFLLERTAKRMKQLAQQRLADSGVDLTVDQWLLLKALAKTDGQSQYQLAVATAKDAPTVTRMIDLLTEKNYCAREPHPSDRRRFRIILLPLGKQRLQEAQRIIQGVRQTAWAGIDEPQLALLQGLLERVLDNLNEARNQ